MRIVYTMDIVGVKGIFIALECLASAILREFRPVFRRSAGVRRRDCLAWAKERLNVQVGSCQIDQRSEC